MSNYSLSNYSGSRHSYFYGFWDIIILLAAFIIYCVKNKNKIQKENLEQEKANQRKKEQKKVEEKILIPKGLPKIKYYGGYRKNLSNWLFFEKDDESICFYDKHKNLKILIKKVDILNFTMNGEYHEDTKVTGGEVKGGGVSVGGALVGGVIAGPVGALLGGRKKVKSTPIKTTTTVTDTRKVVLKFKENNTEQGMILDKTIWDTLCFLCPEKKIQ